MASKHHQDNYHQSQQSAHQGQNIVSYHKQIKSNNQVFQQNQQQVYQNQVNQRQAFAQEMMGTSPNKNVGKKGQNIQGSQNIQKKIIANQAQNQSSSGQHRRSKTDGNIQGNFAFNSNKIREAENMQRMKNQLENNFEKFQNVLPSRQANIGNNEYMNIKNNSNNSVRSAQIQQLHQNFSMEQAAKNLKLGNQHLQDAMLAPTRNSNLQSQPNKDKFNNQMQRSNNTHDASGGSYGSHNQDQLVQIQFKGSKSKGINDKIQDPNVLTTSNGQVSIEQLKELMKNPQIAQFLKEQIDIQQQQQQNVEVPEGAAGQQGIPPNYVQSQQYQICDLTHESNLNSDTSQEILKYQKEWAKQFHEQVQSNQPNNFGQRPQQISANQAAAAAAAAVEQQVRQQEQTPDRVSSSQIIHQDMDASDNRISQIPKSSLVNAMQDLNSASKSNDDKINFYNQHSREHTENSIGGNGTGQVVFEKNSKGQVLTDERLEEEEDQIEHEEAEEDPRSRNILNGGKQLSLMTVCSDVLDNSADLRFDYFQEDSQVSQKEEEDEYLTFQLCEGEEMNNEMANFIGIHMLNDGQQDEDTKQDEEGGLTYQCPETGSHFEFMDLIGRMRNLKQKRNIIDQSIKDEDKRQMKESMAQAKQAQKEMAKQKQIQKQKKLKTQVQNILKSAQQDVSDNEENFNDSMPHTNIMTTDEDVYILEEEDHLQSHHVSSNHQNVNMIQSSYQMDNNGNNPKVANKIYNTHDGRQKQALDENKHINNNNIMNSQYRNQQYTANNIQKQPQNQTYGNQQSVGSNVHGRMTNGAHSQHSQKQQQISVQHQASSLASNHASKISHFSKITAQANFNTQSEFNSQPSPNQSNKHDQQQQMIMNLKYSQQFLNRDNEIAAASKQQNQIHQRGQSDDIHSNQVQVAMNHMTQIHSNQFSSLAGTEVKNTNQFNTALGSQRGGDIIASRGYTNQITNGKHGVKKHAPQQSSGSMPSKNERQQMQQALMNQQKFKNINANKNISRTNQDGSLKQTAQFGPQMNLIKSQIPQQQQHAGLTHQVVTQNATADHMNQHMQQQKSKIQQKKLKSIDQMRQNQGTGFQTQQQHYMTTQAPLHQQNSVNLAVGQRDNRQMILLPQNTGVQVVKQSQGVSQEKRGQMKKHQQQSMGTKPTSISGGGGKGMKQQISKGNTQTNIYQTQQQRKTKLINSGGSQIAGYDIRGSSAGNSVQNNMNNQYQSSATQGNSSTVREQSIQQHNKVVNGVPQTVQSSNNKKYQNQITNMNEASSGAHHLQSYSFDYRQPPQSHYPSFNAVNAPGSSGGQHVPQTVQPSGNSKKMIISNANSGIVRHSKNMRSFDSQHQNNVLVSQNQVNSSHQDQKLRQMADPNSKFIQVSGQFSSKHKSSSLNNPKEQNQSNNHRIQQNNGAQIMINQSNFAGLSISDQHKSAFQQKTTIADPVRDNFYKSMHKKVKSTTNNALSLQNDNNSKEDQMRKSYNSANIGSNISKNLKNVHQKYTPQGNKNGLLENQGQISNDQYSKNLNQNINVFDEQQQFQSDMQIKDQKHKNNMTKSKRITASTRGVTSGTNARVNTFDNRGMQAAAQQQQQRIMEQVPANVKIMNQDVRPISSQALTNQSKEPSQTKLNHRNMLSQQNKNSNQGTRNQQQSPKKNIYLLNYQGNVSII